MVEQLECPVCFNALICPIYQCIEGHVLCDYCHSKLKVCPTCQNENINIRCRKLEDMAETVYKSRKVSRQSVKPVNVTTLSLATAGIAFHCLPV